MKLLDIRLAILGAFLLGFVLFVCGKWLGANWLAGIGWMVVGIAPVLGVIGIWRSGEIRTNWGNWHREQQPIRFYSDFIFLLLMIIVWMCVGVAGMLGYVGSQGQYLNEDSPAATRSE